MYATHQGRPSPETRGEDDDYRLENKKRPHDEDDDYGIPEGNERLHSTDLKNELFEIKNKLKTANVVYDESYFTAQLDENSKNRTMLYIMNVGDPSDPNREPAKRKSVSAYFGQIGHKYTAAYHVDHHNNRNSQPKNCKTRPSAGRWILCMVIALPDEILEYDAANIMHKYGATAHGIAGKIGRATELITMFNLRYYVPRAFSQYIEALMQEQSEFTQRDRMMFRQKRSQQ